MNGKDGEATAREKRLAYLSFAQQRETAQSGDGWLQGRYYSDAGTNVRKYLSFEAVFDISPFEVGVSHREERRAFRLRFSKVVRLLELEDLLPRAFQTLSNGEMRRVLFARALLQDPDVLVLEDPMAGLDPRRREQFRKILGVLRRDGLDVRVTGETEEGAAWRDGTVETARSAERSSAGAFPTPPVVELKDVTIRFGRRTLFRNFSWTVRRGERWVLRGPNGSGKSTLLALITGDSPLAYANDVCVFGERRGPGSVLADVRRRIGMVSPEMQTYLDRDPFQLLETALKRKPELLLLDEPCLNLTPIAARRLLARVARYLHGHPKTTVICVAHRPEHVPAGFDRVLDIGTHCAVRRDSCNGLVGSRRGTNRASN